MQCILPVGGENALAICPRVYPKRQDAIRSQMSQTLYAKKEPER